MSRGSATLRSKLLRWLLIPLSLLFVVDAIGSYFLARHLSNRVYDGELMEIARELNLHVKVVGTVPAFDLEKDAGGVLIAGDAELPPGRPDAAPLAYDGQARGSPVRIAQIRGADHGRAPFTVQVAETLVKRHMLANEILVPLADDPTGATRTVNSPVQVDGIRKVAPKRAPRLGEHSLDVLRELAFPDADIDRLCAAGAVVPEAVA